MHSRWEPTTNICERKFEVDGPRPDLGLDFGGFRGYFKKIEPKTYIILAKSYY